MLFSLLLVSFICPALALPHVSRASGWSRQNSGQGFDIPIHRRVDSGRRHKRGDVTGSIGLGNNADVLYTVPIELGNSVIPVHLDTGSSDLWVISDKCTTGTCNRPQVSHYPTSALKPAGVDVQMLYGDSKTGTFASGPVGRDTATIAGVAMTDHPFGVINATTNPIVQFGAAGIFGLGFPSGSKVQEAVVTEKSGPIDQTDDFIQSTIDDGPLLSRITMTNQLEMPMFTVTLQRSTIDIGGNGLLTVGKLPDGIDNSSLTWVPVRLYRVVDGGLQPPSFAPNEVYPFRWEIDLDGVFFDGKRVPDSTISPVGVNPGRVTALIDTGNSILRGPEDMVNNILRTVFPSYDPSIANAKAIFPCSTPHTLSFQIGGKMFPVDPRDFFSPLEDGDSTNCVADNIVSTDPPRMGSLYSWSLGDTFLKSNLVAFHYGNLTHPSVDPPRIGFLSNVPGNADDLLKQAVEDARNNGGKFEATTVAAPTASAAAETQTTVSSVSSDSSDSSVTPAPSSTTTSLPHATTTITVPPITPTSQGTSRNKNSAFVNHTPILNIWAPLISLLALLLCG